MKKIFGLGRPSSEANGHTAGASGSAGPEVEINLYQKTFTKKAN